MDASRKMADHIGVTSAFDIKIMEEFQEKFGDKKKIESLINRSIQRTTEILRTDKRTQTAILFLTGAFIEGLHISSYLGTPNSKLPEKEKERVIGMIQEQESSLDGLIALMKQLESQEVMLSYLSEFENLKNGFQKIKMNQENEKVSQESLVAFVMMVNSIRSKMVSP